MSFAAGALPGCSEPSRSSTAGATEGGHAASSASAPLAVSSARPTGVQAGLWEALSQTTKRCQIDRREGTASCNGGQLDALSAQLSKGDGISVPELVTTLTAALKSENIELQTLAANVINRGLSAGFAGPSRPVVDAEQARATLEVFAALAPAQAKQAMPLLAHVAFLSGQQSSFYQLLESRPELKPAGYRASLVYGRVPAIERALAFAKAAKTAEQRAVLEGAALMPSWTDEEKSQLCFWALSLLGEAGDEVGGEAGRALAHCGDAGARRILSKLAKLWKASRLQPGHVFALSRVCETEQKRDELELLCNDVRSFLIDVSADEQTRDVIRAEAMRIIAQCFEDAGTAEMFQELARSENPLVSREAKAVGRDAQQKFVKAMRELEAAPGGEQPTGE